MSYPDRMRHLHDVAKPEAAYFVDLLNTTTTTARNDVRGTINARDIWNTVDWLAPQRATPVPTIEYVGPRENRVVRVPVREPYRYFNFDDYGPNAPAYIIIEIDTRHVEMRLLSTIAQFIRSGIAAHHAALIITYEELRALVYVNLLQDAEGTTGPVMFHGYSVLVTHNAP